MTGSAVQRLLLGFVAGALATLIFHQGMFFILHSAGYIPVAAYRMSPVPPFGVPWVINLTFWGGLWGALFALLYDSLGGLPGWAKGLVFGMVGPMLLGTWLVVAYLNGAPLLADYFKDYNVLRLRNGFLLNGVAFGLGVGIIYPLLRSMLGRRGSEPA